MRGRKRKPNITATDLAEVCEVDITTIHNWADRGRIPHFRTEGGHLRFRKPEIVPWLQKKGYYVPAWLDGQGEGGTPGEPREGVSAPTGAPAAPTAAPPGT
jgi:excisionase family DNA binding protein